MESSHGNKPEREGNVEDFNVWKELRDSAPQKAVEVLTEKGLEVDIENASLEEVEQLVATVPEIINTLSENEEGEVQNENRYVVRELGVLLNKAQLKKKYMEAPIPALVQAS